MAIRLARTALVCLKRGMSSRSVHRSHSPGRMRTTVRALLLSVAVGGVAENERLGFIFRHLAGGGPNTGLYAHYELTEELGKGSFATVMKAMSKSTGQWYACKMIHVKQVRASVRVDGNGAKERIDPYAAVHKEVQILGQLRHPNICQLKEVFSDETYISTYTISIVVNVLPTFCRYHLGMGSWW